MKISVILACTSLLALSSAASAAEPAFVNKIGGEDVSVENAAGSAPAGVQTLLESGDRVSAGKGSFAEIKYLADGCIVRVSGGHSLTVAAESPCAGKAEDAQKKASAAAPEKASEGEPKIVPAKAEAAAGDAEVTGQTGSLTRVNRGKGLVELKTGATLRPGDTVFAGPESSVTLLYPAANCEYVVPSETYFEIKSGAPCAKTAGDLARADIQAAPARSDDDDDDDNRVNLFAAGTLVAGGTAILLLALSEDGDDDNDSNEETPVTPQ